MKVGHDCAFARATERERERGSIISLNWICSNWIERSEGFQKSDFWPTPHTHTPSTVIKWWLTIGNTFGRFQSQQKASAHCYISLGFVSIVTPRQFNWKKGKRSWTSNSPNGLPNRPNRFCYFCCWLKARVRQSIVAEHRSSGGEGSQNIFLFTQLTSISHRQKNH